MKGRTQRRTPWHRASRHVRPSLVYMSRPLTRVRHALRIRVSCVFSVDRGQSSKRPMGVTRTSPFFSPPGLMLEPSPVPLFNTGPAPHPTMRHWFSPPPDVPGLMPAPSPVPLSNTSPAPRPTTCHPSPLDVPGLAGPTRDEFHAMA